MSEAFTAAAAVALARRRPARGGSGAAESTAPTCAKAAAVRQVIHTNTVARPVGSMSLIRTAPDQARGAESVRISRCRFSRGRLYRPLPRHPAQHATNGMAGLLARGSLQLAAFPICRLRTDTSGFGQVLAAYSCGGSRGFASERSGARRLPHSLIALSLERGHQGR